MKNLRNISNVFSIITFSLALLFITDFTAHAGVLSANLQSILQTTNPHKEISVIVELADKADISHLKQKDKKLRRAMIIRALKQKSDLTQVPLRTFLKNKKARRIVKLWLINGVAVKAPVKVIKRLADMPGIKSIKLDAIIQAPVTTLGSQAPAEWNIDSIRAPELWARGYTGQGIVVANMDTGVDALHPDLATQWRGADNSWYDPNGEHAISPYDADGHGTQSMGLMTGGDVGGTSIGVVPDAQWIAVKIFNDAGNASYSIIHQGFQWLLDPDGDPDTNDAPDVVNNSWALDNFNNCDFEFQPDIQTLKAAGIAVVFSAGNSGPGQSTSISPSNNPEGFSIGAVDQLNNIASFSSRGPSACDGSIFPRVSAPGVNVRTTDLTFGGIIPDSYNSVSGTSFASPHVAGTMALLLDAFPDLTIAEMEFVLEQSALDLGNAGPDNEYGYGLIDAVEAFNLISVSSTSGMNEVGDLDGNGSRDLAVLWIDPFTGSKDVYVKDGGNGQLIQKLTFDTNYAPYDMIVVPDMNSNGSSEVGILGVHKDTGEVSVEIKDALTGSYIKSIYFSMVYSPKQAEIISDIDNNGKPEIAVLGINVNTGVIRIQAKDTVTESVVSNVFFSKSYTPYQFAEFPDIDNSGVPELGVLGVNINTGKVRVEILDASTGNSISDVYFQKTFSPYQFEVLSDIDNNMVPELAVFGVNGNTGAVRIQIKDAISNNTINKVYFSKDYSPYQFTVIDDSNGNGIPDLGVLGVSNITGRPRVQIKDALTGDKIKSIFFNKDYIPREVMTILDSDGNNYSEIAILGKNRVTGNVHIQIKDTFDGAGNGIISVP